MAGPLSRVLALHRSSAGGEGPSRAPVQTCRPPLPCSIASSAAPAPGPAETPARSQVGRGRQRCSCWGSLCWLQPPALGWLASGQVQPWHRISPPLRLRLGRRVLRRTLQPRDLEVFVSGNRRAMQLGPPAASLGLPGALGAGQEGPSACGNSTEAHKRCLDVSIRQGLWYFKFK